MTIQIGDVVNTNYDWGCGDSGIGTVIGIESTLRLVYVRMDSGRCDRIYMGISVGAFHAANMTLLQRGGSATFVRPIRRYGPYKPIAKALP